MKQLFSSEHKKRIIIIAEHVDKRIQMVTFELIHFAKTLATYEPANISLIIIGDQVKVLADTLARRAGLPVLAIRVPGLTVYNGEIYKDVLEAILPDIQPTYVCAVNSSQGSDFSPGLAVRLGMACFTGVFQIEDQNGGPCFSTFIQGGKLKADFISDTTATMLTVQPGFFRPVETHKGTSGKVEYRTMDLEPSSSFYKGQSEREATLSDLTEAKVIISVGRGIQNKENMEMIYRLAELIPKAAVGCSRPICDQGWLEYKRQIGATGATVKPDLYLACGISGAFQHVQGMQDSEFIVAINKDPHAAIFNVADLCIVEDILSFIPTLISELTDYKPNPEK